MKGNNILIYIPGIFVILLGLIITIPFLYINETSQDLSGILDIYVSIMMFVGIITLFIGGFILLSSGLLLIRINKLEERLGDLSYQIEKLFKK